MTRLGWLPIFLVALATSCYQTPIPIVEVTMESLEEPAAEISFEEPVGIEGQSQVSWIEERIQALVDLYNFTHAGQEWLESYDLRQMVGKPGWFGSLGYQGWAGVGQAIPHSILHEMGHSYYGAFQISGHPELTWETLSGIDLSPAMEQYHEDLITFMLQPPDGYEPLRDRFRNLPNLSRDKNPDLFHFGEADLFYTVGGSLNLTPPILRKYFDQFLQEGEFQAWEQAIAWYLGLSPEDKTLAGSYIGIPHFPLERYDDLEPSIATLLPPKVRTILEREEKQRLKDFAQQFDLIMASEFSSVDAANVDRSFEFWRSYLRDMLELHRKHPQVLVTAEGKGPQLKKALNTFLEAEEMSQIRQIKFFKERLKDPFLMNFAVLLPTRVLMELFSRSHEELPLQSVGGVVGRFSQKLAHYAKEVDDVVSTSRKDLQKGAEKLERFLQSLTDDQQEKDLALIFDLMRDTDRVTAKNVANRLRDEVILRMLKTKASAVRNNNVSPERLLQALEITPLHSPDEIAQGLKTLFKETSGNFQIDEPFTSLAYKAIADVGKRDFQESLGLLRDSEVPLLDFILAQPEASVNILSQDLPEAARLIANPKGYARSPQGIVHGLIYVDPLLATQIVMEMENQGLEDITTESLIVIAFDASRLETNSSLTLSLKQDKEFIQHLLDRRGPAWVQGRIKRALHKYQREVLESRIDENFLEEYRKTLLEIIRLEEDADRRSALKDMLNGAFEKAGLLTLVTQQ